MDWLKFFTVLAQFFIGIMAVGFAVFLVLTYWKHRKDD